MSQQSPLPSVRTLSRGKLVYLSIYWLGLSVLWGAMLGVFLPSRVQALVPAQARGRWLALILASGAIVSAFTQVIIGALSDRSRWRMGRRRPYLLLGTVLGTACLFPLALSESMRALLTSFLLLQFCINIAGGPYQALIPDRVEDRQRGEASGYMGLFEHVGQAGGPVLAGLFMSQRWLDTRGLQPLGGRLWVAGIISVLLMGLMALTVAKVREQAFVNSRREDLGPTILRAFRFDWLVRREFALLVAARFVLMVGFYLAVSFMLYYVGDTLGIAKRELEWKTGLLMLFLTVGGMAGAVPAGILSDRFGRRRVLYFSSAATVVGAVIFISTSSYRVAMWDGLLLGTGFGGFIVVVWAMVCSALPEHEAARYMGIWNLAVTLPQVVAPGIGGPLGDYLNSALGQGAGWRAVFILVLVFLLAGLFIITRIPEKRQPDDSSFG
jgi:MFS family permease